MLDSITSWILDSLPGGSSPNQRPDLSSLPGFAQAVVDKLREDANSLPPGPGINRIKGSFRTFLESMSRHLDSFANAPSHRPGQKRVLDVLDCLEDICQWPLSYGQTRRRKGVFDPEQYPTLKSLLQPHYSAKSAITGFAAARSRKDAAAQGLWEALVDSFDNLAESENAEPEDVLKGPDLSELKKSTTAREESGDNQSFIVHLYTALSEHFKSARCRFQRKSITINLRLNWWCKEPSEHEDVLWFGLFFLSSTDNAPENSKASCRWQDIHISVPKLKEVAIQEPPKFDEGNIVEASETFTTSGPHHTSGSSSPSFEIEYYDEFCDLLESPTEAQLKFAYLTDFEFHSSGPPERPFLRNSSSIPLSNLVGTKRLDPEMKSFLSFHLVRTLWQYYQSDWIRDDWSKESVHFMFDKKFGISKVVSMHEPFLQTQFEKARDEVKTESSIDQKDARSSKRRHKQRQRIHQKTRTHPYPKLLALGIMLLEIELDRSFQDFETTDCHDPDVVNIRHSITANILRNSEIWPPKGIYKCIKQAIEICIKPDTEVLGDNEKEVRWNFFEGVVRPLGTFLAKAWDDSQGMNTIEIGDNTSPSLTRLTPSSNERYMSDVAPQADDSAGEQLQSLPTSMEAEGSPSTDVVGTTMSRDSPYTSNNWFADLDNLNYILEITRDEGDGPAQQETSVKVIPPAKVAILDTGVHVEITRDEGDGPVQQATSVKVTPPAKVAILDTGVHEQYYQDDQNDQSGTKAIKAYKDFVSNEDSVRRDGTGHGTSCVKLLQKVYQGAEIYVGRVFQRKEANDDTKRLMANAIKHAVKEWDVNVICLPSGFTSITSDEQRLISDAISDAKHAKVLIFAAASNLGNTTSIVFPAQLFLAFDLFCMFSTTADVKPCDFHPAAAPQAVYNFAILGEDIKLPPDPNPFRGTSFSTIIAAGISAHIIHFSRHPTMRVQIRDHESLQEVYGMSAVFAKMVSARDNGYHCLTPWKLLGGMTVQRYSEEKIREEICRTISDALKGRYDVRL